jgi:hypothetical protein
MHRTAIVSVSKIRDNSYLGRISPYAQYNSGSVGATIAGHELTMPRS